ncbi:MAG TPA: hypothetical protein VFJ97_03455 [Dermatophilaceae bacterium]|nr:hypothetical protein [Dermatophilaceae bacterium]
MTRDSRRRLAAPLAGLIAAGLTIVGLSSCAVADKAGSQVGRDVAKVSGAVAGGGAAVGGAAAGARCGSGSCR